jgi:hypothetical protein
VTFRRVCSFRCHAAVGRRKPCSRPRSSGGDCPARSRRLSARYGCPRPAELARLRRSAVLSVPLLGLNMVEDYVGCAGKRRLPPVAFPEQHRQSQRSKEVGRLRKIRCSPPGSAGGEMRPGGICWCRRRPTGEWGGGMIGPASVRRIAAIEVPRRAPEKACTSGNPTLRPSDLRNAGSEG